MSTTYVVTQPNTPYALDNSTFDVKNGASLDLTGSSNLVILENGAGVAPNSYDPMPVTISGNGNTVAGSSDNGATILVSGSDNVVSAGTGTYVQDGVANDDNTALVSGGNGDTITVGANSQVDAGVNSTINISSGLVQVVDGASAAIDGSNNTVDGFGGNFSLNGSNNSVYMAGYSASRTDTITTSVDSLALENGEIVISGSVNPGVLAVQSGNLQLNLGNGNVISMFGVGAGTTVEYVDPSGKTTSSVVTDPNLVHLGGSLYDVAGSMVYANMSGSIFDVLANDSLNLTGNSNQVILESGAGTNINSGYLTVSGNGNSVMANDGSGTVVLAGSNNSVTAGANADIVDGGADAGVTPAGDGHNDTITAGMGSSVIAGSNTTINMSSGSVFVREDTDSAVVNGNNNAITDGGTVSISGNGNTVYALYDQGTISVKSGSGNVITTSDNCSIDDSGGTGDTINTSTNAWGGTGSGNNIVLGSGDTANVIGSNNTISFDANNTSSGQATTINLPNGVYVEEAANGQIWYSTDVNYSFSLKNGVATLTFDNNNKVVISDVKSGPGDSLMATSQTNQLVSAMASYAAAPGGVSSTLAAQTAAAPSLFASAHQ